MTRYISAYELQQRDGLTRQQVTELAEKGPAYWKASGAQLLNKSIINGFFTVY